MLTFLIILLICLVIYFYWQWKTNATNFSPKPPETKPWQEDFNTLQAQINELKNHD